MRSGRAGSRGAGGPRGAGEFRGPGCAARARARGAQLPLPWLGWPGVIHSQPGGSWRGRLLPETQFLPGTQRPSHPDAGWGDKDATAKLGRPAGRYGLTASPTFLPPRARSAATFWGSAPCADLGGVRAGRGRSGIRGRVQRAAVGGGLNAWARGWRESLEIRILAQLPQAVTAGKLLSLSVKRQR